MKSRIPEVLCARVLFTLLFLFILGSCASPPVRTEPAAEKSEYLPTKVFALNFSSAWETTLHGLQKEGIPIGTQDREKGIIRTNFQDGPEMKRQGKTYSSRYKYNIFLFREGNRKIILNLRCQYEGREKGGMVFFDGSYLFPGEVVALENRMYQTIESYLLPLQASRAEEPGTDERPVGMKRGSAAGPAPTDPVSPPEPLRVPQTSPPPPAAGQEVSGGYSPSLPGKDPSRPSDRPAEERLAVKSPPGKAAPAVPPKGAASRIWITKGEASLREGPSLKSKIILKLKKGMKVEKVGQSGTWIKVKLWEKTLGWVPKELLQEAP